jgi:hypothetical protein
MKQKRQKLLSSDVGDEQIVAGCGQRPYRNYHGRSLGDRLLFYSFLGL